MADDFFRRNSADQDKKMHTESLAVPNLGMVHRSNPLLAVRIDAVSDTLMYIGRAAVGAPAADPEWQIKRLTLTVAGSVIIEYADADNAFDNVWNSRAGLSYG